MVDAGTYAILAVVQGLARFTGVPPSRVLVAPVLVPPDTPAGATPETTAAKIKSGARGRTSGHTPRYSPAIDLTNVMPLADDWNESGPDRKVIGANGASDHLNGARV